MILLVVPGFFKEGLPRSVRVLNSLSHQHGSKRIKGCKPMPNKIEITNQVSCNVYLLVFLFLVVVAVIVWSTQPHASILNSPIYF